MLVDRQRQFVSGTGASWPGPATEQSDSGTGVLSPGPSLRQKNIQKVQPDSWNNSLDRYDHRDKWTDVWKSDHDGNRWIHGWNDTTTTPERTLGESVTLVTSGVRATGKRAAAVRATGRRADGTRPTSVVTIAKGSSGRVVLSSRQ